MGFESFCRYFNIRQAKAQRTDIQDVLFSAQLCPHRQAEVVRKSDFFAKCGGLSDLKPKLADFSCL